MSSCLLFDWAAHGIKQHMPDMRFLHRVMAQQLVAGRQPSNMVEAADDILRMTSQSKAAELPPVTLSDAER